MPAATLEAPTLRDASGAGCCDQAQTGFAAYGTLIQICSNPGVTPEEFVSIAGLGDIGGPTSSMGEAETTSHSGGAAVRTYIPTMAEPGELSFPCFWNPEDPTQAIDSPYGLEYLFWNRIVTKFRLVASDPSHYTRVACGFVKSLGEAYPTQGIATRQITIRITSPWQVTAPAISLTPAEATIAAAGGPSTFSVKAGGSTALWTAVPDVSWITITAPTAPTEGDEDVEITVAAGTAARVGHVQIPELRLSFKVNQSAT
jgi:hypothetical protein